MPGDIFSKERTAVTISSSQAALSSGNSQAMGVDLDFRNSGNAAEDFACVFELFCQWATITGIAAGTIIADIYLIPKLDGTNLPDLDLTTSTGLPPQCLVGNFQAVKAPVANTNMRFVSNLVEGIHPMLYTVHLMNRSGQQIASGMTVKALSARVQYS